MKKPTQAELEAFEAGIVRRPRLYLAEPCGCDIYLIAGETPDYE